MDMIKVRASSLGDLFDCPARWQAKFIYNQRLPTSGVARLGTAIHAGTALYDQSRIDGVDLTADDCAGAVVDTIYKAEDEEVDWSEQSQSEAEKIAISLHKKYCKEIAPSQNYIAVEATCEKLDISDLGISLTGTTDRIRETSEGEFAITDLKTSKTIVGADGTVKTSGYGVQLAIYNLLASQAMQCPITGTSQIIGLNTGKTEKAQRVAIADVSTSIDILLGDESSPGLLQYASRIFQSGDFYGNPRSMLCNKKFCPCYDNCKWK